MHVAYHKSHVLVGYLFIGTNNNLVLAIDLIPLPSYLTCIVMEVACDLGGNESESFVVDVDLAVVVSGGCCLFLRMVVWQPFWCCWR